jgi:uncharacterized protein YgbK (DUF1537 family)
MVDAAFYADDFTGSTDALAQFARVGLRAALLVTLPPASELAKLSEQYDVIGVAGIARSLPPDRQEEELRPILAALRDLDPRVVQYKVCSTADSGPRRGSIGRALEVGREVFGPAVVPVLVAQPELGRYTVFSNHYATEDGVVYRLDRQPTMSVHPATPMHESDLRLHLAAQTDLRIASLHLTTYANLPAAYAAITATDAAAVVLDALSDDDLHSLGSTILAKQAATTGADACGTCFAIGSGGLSRAIALALRTEGSARALALALRPGGSGPPADQSVTRIAAGRPLQPMPPPRSHRRGAVERPAEPMTRPGSHGQDGVEQVLVVSGSQSHRTAEQIEHARSAAWKVLPLGDETASLAVKTLSAGVPGVVVHTNEVDAEELRAVPAGLAHVIRRVTEAIAVRRIVVAGGDTSGQVLRLLELTALELAETHRPLSPGVHLCRTTSVTPSLDGLEMLLKPGQLGEVDLFTTFQTM